MPSLLTRFLAGIRTGIVILKSAASRRTFRSYRLRQIRQRRLHHQRAFHTFPFQLTADVVSLQDLPVELIGICRTAAAAEEPGEAGLAFILCIDIVALELFHNVRFPKGIIFEDMHTLPRLLEQTKTVVTTSLGCYYYCMNDAGITATADGNALRMLLQPHVEIIRNSQRRDRDFQTYYLHVLNIQMDVYEQTGDVPILPDHHLEASNFEGAQRLKATALNILGINRICKVNKFIHKFSGSR